MGRVDLNRSIAASKGGVWKFHLAKTLEGRGFGGVRAVASFCH